MQRTCARCERKVKAEENWLRISGRATPFFTGLVS